MIKKFPYLLLAGWILAYLAPFQVHASPMFKIGESVDIFLTARSELQYQSNIFSSETNEEGDFIWLNSPGFEIVAGGDSNTNITLKFYEEFAFYFDESDQNHSTEHLNLSTRFDGGGKLRLDTIFKYDETVGGLNATTFNTQSQLIRWRTFELGFHGAYQISPKTVIETGLEWLRFDYRNYTDIYADRNEYSIPTTIFYAVTPKVEVGLGYTPTYTDVHLPAFLKILSTNGFLNNSTLPADSMSHFVNLAVRGAFTEKLNGEARIGYIRRDLNPGAAFNDVGAELKLTYTPTAKLVFSLLGARNFATDSDGVNLERTSINFVGRYNITEKVNFTAKTGYTWTDYHKVDRDDHLWLIGADLGYSPLSWLELGIGYNYATNDSSLSGSDYVNHMARIFAQAKY